jgi:hypothetical protein
MKNEEKAAKLKDSHPPDVAAQRRKQLGGQLHHNLEEPVEEGEPVTPPAPPNEDETRRTP